MPAHEDESPSIWLNDLPRSPKTERGELADTCEDVDEFEEPLPPPPPPPTPSGERGALPAAHPSAAAHGDGARCPRVEVEVREATREASGC
mgnify:CR=1 FL=1